ncbi:MAG: alpha/beta-type small acid-soluble spore protein [Syntrophomonadaceae bacterium]|jgi:small acid-soluble spore protein D (minor alpha/beta-type SASP)|nr:alpha/beta-type small acid-soluble spore protein [Syntrophomonadaceae bacterium]
MGSGQKRNRVLVPEAQKALYDFKHEIARELGVAQNVQGDYWGNVSSRENGAVGGNMVRKMIAFAESQLASNAQAITNQPLTGNTNARNPAGNQPMS